MSLVLSIHKKIESYYITHNLTEMADKVVIDGITLYQVLWRGDEYGFDNTENTKQFLLKAIPYMEKNKNKLLKYNPDNGWGDYEGLLKFCKNVLKNCYIDGYIQYSR